MVIVTMIYCVGIAMALVVGGAIGLVLTTAYHQWSTMQRQRYEQEIAEDTVLYAAARASGERYSPTWSRNKTPKAL